MTTILERRAVLVMIDQAIGLLQRVRKAVERWGVDPKLDTPETDVPLERRKRNSGRRRTD